MVTRFNFASILRHFNHKTAVIIETDPSEYVSARVLSHNYDEGIRYPGDIISAKHSLAECIYDIHDKELIALIKALKGCRAECEGATHILHLITDHKIFEYFMPDRLLN
jgi:hypothetical protein